MTGARLNVPSGSPLELEIGFSRAVRAGNTIAVAGTAPIAEDGTTACPGDVYGQTRRCLTISLDAAARAGGDVASVTRTRIMLTDISTWRDAARAHGEVFKDIRPACTLVEVKGFIDPEWLVETEMDCMVDEG